jgi:p-hydroxybenzoate 3-monooxygenase
VTKDLIDAREAASEQVIYEAKDVQIHDLDSDTPRLSYDKNGKHEEFICDFVVGCDGYHGISRKSIPDDVLRII